MFSLREFIKRGFINAVGKMADYQIILNAAGWLEKGVLEEADLMEIQAAIDEQYVIKEEPQEEILIPEDIFEDEEDPTVSDI